MRYIHHEAPCAPADLVIANGKIPEPKRGEIRIRVHYAGVNRPDILQRQGAYPPPADASPVLGLECSGVVDALGEDVTQWSLGDEVCALLPGGGYAEYAVCDARHALPIPANMSLEAAAALPETYFTVWTNVFERGGLRKGEQFLVHGGSSGIGTTAIQLAHVFGATVFATAGNDEKCEICRKLGATFAINYKDEDFLSVVKANGGADLILDMVGGAYIEKNIRALNPDGRLVNIAYLQGSTAEINFMPIMMKRLTVTGSTLRPRSNNDKAAIAAALHANVWPLIEAGKVAPVIDKTFALHDVGKAHEYMDQGTHIGKVVLKVTDA